MRHPFLTESLPKLRKTNMRSLVSLFLLLSGTALAEEHCGFESGREGWSAARSRIAVSSLRKKEGTNALVWSWNTPGAQLRFDFPEKKTTRSKQTVSHFGLWLYAEKPLGRLTAELYYGGKLLTSCWFNLGFSGWRVLGINTETLGLPAGTRYDRVIFRPEDKRGIVWIDAVKPCFLSAPIQADYQQPWANQPDLLLRPSAADYNHRDVSRNRPWLPRLVAIQDIPKSINRQMEELRRHYLNGLGHKGRAYRNFAGLVQEFTALGITEENGIVSGPPLTLSGNGFLTLPGSLDFNGRFVPVFLQLAAACHREQGMNRRQAEEMYVLLCRYLLDQGFQEGNGQIGWIGNGYDFRHYPPAVFAHRDLLERAGLLDAMAKSTAWLCMGEVMLSEHPYSSMDQFYNYSAHLPAAILMIPDEAERYQRLRAFKRYLDITIGDNPLPFGTDGTAHHHTGHHLSYGGYTPPALLQTQILPFKDTVFRIAPRTQEKLRTYARACSFQTMHNRLAPNLYLRSGASLPFSAAPAALKLARLGTPDGKENIDRDMAAIYLDALDGTDSPDAKEFRASGIGAARPSGHMSLNRAATALHRRGDWQAAAVGMCREHRGLEIYGWTESNNYGRYSRNGTLFLTLGRETGWRREGWNGNFWPGGTNPVRNNHDLFEGYALYSNGNDRAGGVELEGDGLWGNDFECRDLAMKKSYFFFGNLIVCLTSGIRTLDAPGLEVVTTLFQQAVEPDSAPSHVDGRPIGEEQQWNASSRAHVLADQLGNLYLIEPGSVLRCRRAEQEWTYFNKADLIDAKNNPCLDMRRKQFRETPFAANARFYKPTRGVFDLAWISHGSDPQNASCHYTICVAPSDAEADAFRRGMASPRPPVAVLQKDGAVHAVRHRITNTTGYAVYVPGSDLPPPLKGVNMPCFVMVRDLEDRYLIAAFSGDPRRKEPIRLQFHDGTRVQLDPAYPLAAKVNVRKFRARQGR